jgi:hypothetical protein
LISGYSAIKLARQLKYVHSGPNFWGKSVPVPYCEYSEWFFTPNEQGLLL